MTDKEYLLHKSFKQKKNQDFLVVTQILIVGFKHIPMHFHNEIKIDDLSSSFSWRKGTKKKPL